MGLEQSEPLDSFSSFSLSGARGFVAFAHRQRFRTTSTILVAEKVGFKSTTSAHVAQARSAGSSVADFVVAERSCLSSSNRHTVEWIDERARLLRIQSEADKYPAC
jgi:hypothetical protein